MLAIAGGKGGSGKTTTALGVASALAVDGIRPLVVDTDVAMPDLHHRAGIEQCDGPTTTATVADPGAAAQRSPHLPGVDVLPCSGAATGDLESVLERLSSTRRPVVLDCPAGAGPDAVTPLRWAAQTVLVSTPDEQSLRDTAKTAAMARVVDATPTVTVLSRSDGGVDPSPLLECSTTVHVPEVSDSPLESERCDNRHREVVKSLNKRNV